LLPLISIVPLSGVPPRMRKLSIRDPVLGLQPRPDGHQGLVQPEMPHRNNNRQLGRISVLSSAGPSAENQSFFHRAIERDLSVKPMDRAASNM
jgi:hypothetical protein